MIGAPSDSRAPANVVYISHQVRRFFPGTDLSGANESRRGSGSKEGKRGKLLKLTIKEATVELEPEADCARHRAVGENSNHICAHNWWRKFVPDGTVWVLVCSQQLFACAILVLSAISVGALMDGFLQLCAGISRREKKKKKKLRRLRLVILVYVSRQRGKSCAICPWAHFAWLALENGLFIYLFSLNEQSRIGAKEVAMEARDGNGAAGEIFS